MLSSQSLKQKIYRELRESGFKFKDNKLLPPNLKNKNALRRAHRPAKTHLLLANNKWIIENEAEVLDSFADGSEITPEEISPELVLVENEENASLFRYASYLWSIPLSNGFGRRLRYLIKDKSNDKLIGIVGLTDPVIGLRVRDDWIGWTRAEKERRLWHVMDLYAFGAVAPYNNLLGGKLVATLATTKKVRDDFKRKYSSGRSNILHRNNGSRKAGLTLLTTTGAFGESSILDRLRTVDAIGMKERPVDDNDFKTKLLWQFVGLTQGWGFFHLNNGIATEMFEYLKAKDDELLEKNRFGDGPNWKMRVIRHCLNDFGLDYKKYGKHGVQRGFYAAPLASNFREVLSGEETKPKYFDYKLEPMFEYFKERYLLPRAERDLTWKSFDHSKLSLTAQLANM